MELEKDFGMFRKIIRITINTTIHSIPSTSFKIIANSVKLVE